MFTISGIHVIHIHELKKVMATKPPSLWAFQVVQISQLSTMTNWISFCYTPSQQASRDCIAWQLKPRLHYTRRDVTRRDATRSHDWVPMKSTGPFTLCATRRDATRRHATASPELAPVPKQAEPWWRASIWRSHRKVVIKQCSYHNNIIDIQNRLPYSKVVYPAIIVLFYCLMEVNHGVRTGPDYPFR